MVRIGNNDMMSDDAKRVSLKALAERMLNKFTCPETSKAEVNIIKYLIF